MRRFRGHRRRMSLSEWLKAAILVILLVAIVALIVFLLVVEHPPL